MNNRIKNKKAISGLCLCLVAAFLYYAGCAQHNIPEALEVVTGDDGSTWERVCEAGFGNEDNISVVAMAEYNGRLYAMTRNDAQGCEVWRTVGTGWEQIRIAGDETHGIYGNMRINNVWGRMIVFKDKLYVGFSSGLQGTYLGSTGCEIWRYDGEIWEPVISNKKDRENFGVITVIEGCDDNDGDTTAQITDNTKSWGINQWAGAVLQITSGEGNYRTFTVISNTGNTLTVQQNEISGDGGSEYTVCSKTRYDNPFPVWGYDLGAVQAGDTYELGSGYDESGFGDVWNKTITAMRIFENKLYVSTGLNYDYGAQVWVTENGDVWEVTQPPNSFGNYHPNPKYENSQKAVSSSITDLCVSSVSGKPVLYAGGTGTSGSEGGCSRMAKLTDSRWELIVDKNVDANDTGTNENGFGDGMKCDMFTGNFMPWSLADFNNKLFVGINSLGGIRVLYSPTGSSEDGSWFFSVGGDSLYPVAFDEELLQTDDPSLAGTFKNIALNLFSFNDTMYGGVVSQKSDKVPEGSDIWKASDENTWTPITGDGFGDSAVLAFEGFAVFGNTIYVSASKATATDSTGGGAKIYRLAQ